MAGLVVRVPKNFTQDFCANCRTYPLLDLFAKPWIRSFTTTSILESGKLKLEKKKRPRYQDAYSNRRAEARKAANLARQDVLRKERTIAMGDPIRGASEPTPFLKSLDTGFALEETSPGQAEKSSLSRATQFGETLPNSSATLNTPQPSRLNNFVTLAELKRSLEFSSKLTAPYIDSSRDSSDPGREAELQQQHANEHATASEVMSRILAVDAASSRQRTRINVQRIISRFGRHVTDNIFPPRLTASGEPKPERIRIGTDTGSSEVQIAILTAKIRRLADAYESHGRNDKANKRNLRLLLHRRQKLLQYFRKKDRGGKRWEHLIETLGLTEATWQGEIAVQ